MKGFINKNLYLFIFCVFSNTFFCFAQDESIKMPQNVQHSWFLEFFGSSISIYNLNYDCAFQITEKQKIAVGLGGQFVPKPLIMSPPIRPAITGITAQINYLYGKNNNYLELGAGYTITWFYPGSEVSIWKAVPIRIGYRHQKERGGFFWKIAFTPLFGDISEGFEVRPSGGIAIGHTFRI